MRVAIFKAQRTGGKVVEDLTVVAEHTIPELAPGAPEPDWQRQAMALHDGDALRLEEALYTSLPGGTYDALLRRMLLRRASFFRVPFA